MGVGLKLSWRISLEIRLENLIFEISEVDWCMGKLIVYEIGGSKSIRCSHCCEMGYVRGASKLQHFSIGITATAAPISVPH